MIPKRSPWWIFYIHKPKVDDASWNKVLFRMRFRFPYESFLDLLLQIKDHGDQDKDDLFERWRERKADQSKKKTEVSPIELLVLGSLRYLGRGWTFDDLEESTFIARDVHRAFFTSLWSLVVRSTFTQGIALFHPH